MCLSRLRPIGTGIAIIYQKDGTGMMQPSGLKSMSRLIATMPTYRLIPGCRHDDYRAARGRRLRHA